MGICGNNYNIDRESKEKRKKNKNRVDEVEIEGSPMIKRNKDVYKVSPSVY